MDTCAHLYCEKFKVGEQRNTKASIFDLVVIGFSPLPGICVGGGT